MFLFFFKYAKGWHHFFRWKRGKEWKYVCWWKWAKGWYHIFRWKRDAVAVHLLMKIGWRVASYVQIKKKWRLAVYCWWNGLKGDIISSDEKGREWKYVCWWKWTKGLYHIFRRKRDGVAVHLLMKTSRRVSSYLQMKKRQRVAVSLLIKKWAAECHHIFRGKRDEGRQYLCS